MRSQVAQLKPRLEPFTAAVDAYRGGRPIECLNLLHGHVGVASDLLRARAHLRVGQAECGLEVLAPIDGAQLPSHNSRSEVLILRAALQTGLRDFERARETLDAARVFAFSSASAALEAEFHYYDAYWSFAGSDLDETERAAQRALDIAPIMPGITEIDYFVPLPNSRARALQIRGLVAASQRRYREQLGFIRSAIGEMRVAKTPDVWIFASLLMNLAFQVRDFDLVDDAAMLRAEIQLADWPPELAPMRFHIHRSLGWSSALRGDHLGAFREFRRSSEFAQTPPWKIVASTDRAFLGRELGERTMAREELEYAAELAERIDWNAIGEERCGLLFLAREVAAFAPNRGRELFDRYKRIATKLSPGVLNAVDRRLRAGELFAEGTIARALGELERAKVAFIDAFDIWEPIEYRWQAATAALELAELGVGERFLAYVAREASARPSSWLAKRFGALTSAGANTDLLAVT